MCFLQAHRIVLIAACPKLRKMDNAFLGSHLEIRMESDIKEDSVNTFLQYIYEGFLKLTEENCRDIEKMAKLLQVDGVVKCCVDFYKRLSTKTGIPHGGTNFNAKHNSDIQHVKSGNIHEAVSECAKKRGGEIDATDISDHIKSSKRQRISRNEESPRNQECMQDGMGYIRECLEVVHSDPTERDNKTRDNCSTADSLFTIYIFACTTRVKKEWRTVYFP